jgi:hypothetical protein
MKIESKIGKSESGSEIIYNFITDFRNFKNIIPQDKVSDWQADEESCSFKLDPLGKMGMKIFEKEPHKLIKISSDPAVSQYNFTMWIQIKEAGPEDSRIKITIEPDISKMLIPMVKGPLKKFVDSLVDKMENFNYRDPNGSS